MSRAAALPVDHLFVRVEGKSVDLRPEERNPVDHIQMEMCYCIQYLCSMLLH